MLGFGLVSGVVKVFPVGSISVSEKIDQEETSTTRPDDEMGFQVV